MITKVNKARRAPSQLGTSSNEEIHIASARSAPTCVSDQGAGPSWTNSLMQDPCSPARLVASLGSGENQAFGVVLAAYAPLHWLRIALFLFSHDMFCKQGSFLGRSWGVQSAGTSSFIHLLLLIASRTSVGMTFKAVLGPVLCPLTPRTSQTALGHSALLPD